MSPLTIGLLIGFGSAIALVLLLYIVRGGRVAMRFGPGGPVPFDGPPETVERSSLKVRQGPDGRVVVERDGQTQEYASLDQAPQDVREMVERARQMGPGTHVATEQTVRREIID